MSLKGEIVVVDGLAKVLPPHVSVRDKRVINEFKRLKQEAEDEMQAVLHEQAVTCP